ncbi:MAG: hypothetical protein CL816_06280 [Coxiellaceae bacterium]|nr:hypothetical protein [Coxiellaceae bacterium]|tara:strand:+ start:2826 stop:3623 length:798 start_codon:yes stop_codon:yes gene_type:complete
MASTNHTFLFSTYARTLISDWIPAKTWIEEHTISALKAQHQQTVDASPELLNEAQLDEITTGPYHTFIKNSFNAYAKIVFARQQHRMFTDDTFKDFSANHQSQLTNAQLDTIANLKLGELQKNLSELFQENTQSWQTVIRQWQQAIAKPLTQYQLTARELEEFFSYDPLSEVLNRFNDLNLDTPKTKKTVMNFSEYLRLKTILLLYSALSRQHIPHSQTDLSAASKPLKSLFSQIQQQDKELNQQQASQYDVIVKPLQFIKLHQI